MKNIQQIVESDEFVHRCSAYAQIKEFMSLDEGESNKEVLDAIKSSDYESDPNVFHKSINKSKHHLMLSPYTAKEWGKMKLFKLRGYDIGFALKKKDGKFQELVGVFNNEKSIKGIGTDLVKSAITKGAVYLDHFDGSFLTKFYQDLGFEEYDREPYDPQYDEGGEFAKKHGKLDVVWRKLKK